MTEREKFYGIIRTYKIYIKNIDFNFLNEIILKEVMLKAYEFHKDIQFETYIRNCVNKPIEYLYTLAMSYETDFYHLHLLNNCFKDKSDVHYGLKVENKWYFLTHSKNFFSIPVYDTEFLLKPKDLGRITYLTTYTSAPNLIRANCGTIKKRVIECYNNTKF